MSDEPKCARCNLKSCNGCKPRFFTGYKPNYYFRPKFSNHAQAKHQYDLKDIFKLSI